MTRGFQWVAMGVSAFSAAVFGLASCASGGGGTHQTARRTSASSGVGPNTPSSRSSVVDESPPTFLTASEIARAEAVVRKDAFVSKIFGGHVPAPYEVTRAFLTSAEVISHQTPALMVMVRVRSAAPITIPAHDVPLFDIGDIRSKSPLGYDVWSSPGVITNAFGAQMYVDLRLSKVIGIGAIDDPLEPHPTETFPDGYVPPRDVLARSHALID